MGEGETLILREEHEEVFKLSNHRKLVVLFTQMG